MNIEKLKEKGWIIYEVISGSHAYGTNVEGSDRDIRGVYIQPTSTMLGLTGYFPQISDEKNDTTYYEIGTFLELLSKGNPNMLELLYIPEDCILYKSTTFDEYFTEEVKQKFITKKLKHTFTGYAYSQIKKASGLEKMMNWEEQRVERKDVLDFCYVLLEKEESVKFKKWYEANSIILRMENIGLAKVNNMPDIYSMYEVPGNAGIIGDDSNEVRTVSIPQGSIFMKYFRFDRNAYSTHCKDYRQYQEWLEKRNVQRYVDIENHGQKIDGKNMLHLARLLNMSKDIAEGRGIVVRRPEAEYLKEIRKGVHNLDELLKKANETVEEIKAKFDSSDLPHGVDSDFINNLLTSIRMENLMTAIARSGTY